MSYDDKEEVPKRLEKMPHDDYFDKIPEVQIPNEI